MAATNYLQNKLIDWFVRAQSFTPPSSFFIALTTSASTPSSPGAEVSAVSTGYSRKEIVSSLTNWAGTQAALSTTVSSGTSGNTSNNISVVFGTATADWGTITNWEAWDASTGGNRLFYGTIVDGSGNAAPRTVKTVIR